MENQYITTSDYSKLPSSTLDAKVTQTKLVNQI